MKAFRCTFGILFLAIAVVSTGCLEPDREGYRDMAAQDYCAEAERCNNLGDYNSVDDCEVDMRSTFNDFWPASECSDGRIDPDAYETCMNRALNYACDGGLADWWTAVDRCSASKVCTN